MANRKRKNNDLQNTAQKTKDWAKQTQMNLGGMEGLVIPASL